MLSKIILVSGIANLVMGTVVLFGSNKKKGVYSFVFFCLVAFAWALSNFFIYVSDNPLFARAAYATGAMAIFSLLGWTCNLSSEKTGGRIGMIFAYILGIMFAALPLLTDYIIYDLQKIAGNGFAQKYGSLFPLYALSFLITYILVLAILIRFFRRSRLNQRRQSKIILIGISIYVGLSVLFAFILPLFGYHELINLDAPLSMVFVGFVAYAIVSYKWMNIKLIVTEALSILIIAVSLTEVLLAVDPMQRFYRIVIFLATGSLAILLIRSALAEIRSNERLEVSEKNLKKANKELRRLDKAKTDFINIASHQLRSPVTIIKGVISLLRSGDIDQFGDKEKKQFYDSAWFKCIKLEDNINDIIRANVLSSKKYAINSDNAGKINLIDFFSKIAKDFEAEAKEEKISLSFLPEKSLGDTKEMYGHNDYLEGAFGNLINNSIKYTSSKKKGAGRKRKKGENGFIRISLGKDPAKSGNILVKISDNGIGIPADMMPKLFNKFERGGNAKSVYTDGSGLGLFIVKEIVEGHGGKVWVKSKLDEGTTFFVSIPINNIFSSAKKRGK